MSEPIWTDCVLDLETGDTDPARGFVFQISAIKFNALTREVSEDVFDHCLNPATQVNRRWEESTRSWWMKRPEVLKAILARSEDTYKVLQDLLWWTGGNNMRMWAKPTHFDHSFLSSLYKDYGLQIPFHFREAVDINSFAKGVYWPESPPKWGETIPFSGTVHNAVDDCWHQLKCIYRLLDKERPGAQK